MRTVLVLAVLLIASNAYGQAPAEKGSRAAADAIRAHQLKALEMSPAERLSGEQVTAARKQLQDEAKKAQSRRAKRHKASMALQQSKSSSSPVLKPVRNKKAGGRNGHAT